MAQWTPSNWVLRVGFVEGSHALFLLNVRVPAARICATQAGAGRTSKRRAQSESFFGATTMNIEIGHLFGRPRIEYRFGTLVDRTIREQRSDERRLSEQRATKHRFQARNSCILDGRNYRIARRLLLLARAQF